MGRQPQYASVQHQDNNDDDEETTNVPLEQSLNVTLEIPPTGRFLVYFCKTKGLVPIVMVSFFITFSYGNIITLLPKIATQRFAVLSHGFDQSAPQCHEFSVKEDKPQACLLGSGDAQDAHAWSELVANLFTLIFGSVVGSISDTEGRQKWLAIGTTLALAGNFAFLYVCLVPTASPWIFYAIRPVHGLVNWTIVALAAVADQVPPHWRAPSVGLVMAAYWSGVCLGPTVAAVLGMPLAVWTSCGWALVAMALATWGVPETLTTEAAHEARLRHQVEHSTVYSSWQPGALQDHPISCLFQLGKRPLQELSILNRDSLFRLLSFLAFFNGLVTSGDKILLLYYVDTKLSFSVKDTALMMILLGIGAVMAQAVLLKPLNDWIGERWIVILSFGTAIIANIMYGLAETRTTIYGGILVGSVAGMAFPTFSAIKANNVEPSEQGRIQGALYSILALASGIGPLLLRTVDAISIRHFQWSGAMFLFAALLQAVACLCSCYLPKDRTNSSRI